MLLATSTNPDSIAGIWALWVCSLTVLAVLTIRGLGRVRWSNLQRLARDEDGAAYTLAYVMVIPLYVTFMCLAVETTLVILAKFGTNYAAFAAARAAAVHDTNQSSALAQEWAQRAAVQAFVPFANGTRAASQSAGGAESVGPSGEEYLAAYTAYATKPANPDYLRRKYADAAAHISCTVALAPYEPPVDEEPWLHTCAATVDYRYTFHIPLVGRLLGQTDASGTFYHLVSTATLDGEAPKNDDQSLGINYDPLSPEDN